MRFSCKLISKEEERARVYIRGTALERTVLLFDARHIQFGAGAVIVAWQREIRRRAEGK